MYRILAGYVVFCMCVTGWDAPRAHPPRSRPATSGSLGNTATTHHRTHTTQAFGVPGRIVVTLFFNLELTCALGIFLVLFVDNIGALYPLLPKYERVLIFVGIVLPTTW